jgi:hypothetical protein
LQLDSIMYPHSVPAVVDVVVDVGMVTFVVAMVDSATAQVHPHSLLYVGSTAHSNTIVSGPNKVAQSTSSSTAHVVGSYVVLAGVVVVVVAVLTITGGVVTVGVKVGVGSPVVNSYDDAVVDLVMVVVAVLVGSGGLHGIFSASSKEEVY